MWGEGGERQSISIRGSGLSYSRLVIPRVMKRLKEECHV